MKTIDIITNSEETTKEIASSLATYVKPGDVITLEGDLGSGKTTFTKGLAAGLGVKRNVTSPTFTIIKEYNGRIPLYHMDVYRLEHSDEDIGFTEYFDGDGVTVVEWAKFIEDFMPNKYLAITIKVIDDTSRKITCQSNHDHYDQVIEQLKQTIAQ